MTKKIDKNIYHYVKQKQKSTLNKKTVELTRTAAQKRIASSVPKSGKRTIVQQQINNA